MAVAIVLTLALHSIELDEARARIDLVAADILRFGSREGSLVTIGESLPVAQELTQPGNLDHWASPSTYVEVDNRNGYELGQSSNMGSTVFAASPRVRPAQTTYLVEQTPLGLVLVRDELVTFSDHTTVVLKVAEKLELFYATLSRMRRLLFYVVILAAVFVLGGSFIIASGAIKPIDDLAGAMRRIRSSEELSGRLSWPSRSDEIGRLSAEFNAMLARLEEAFARERQFISDASHELKTPLTAIHANAELLERWGDRDATIRAESLRTIRDESAALGRMVTGLLTLAKAESGDGIPLEPVALDAVVAEAARLGELRAREKSLAFHYASALPAGQPLVFGEANLLRQLFTNLVDNALKFTEHGGISIALLRRKDQAIVEIFDTGIGIDDESLARIFDRFYRADKSHSRLVEGTGLGLAIVRSIARVHGGTVVASHNPGGGTIFTVSLPVLAESTSITEAASGRTRPFPATST